MATDRQTRVRPAAPAARRGGIAAALFAPVDVASLVAFRVAFGALMSVAIGRYFVHGWIDSLFVRPTFFFPYEGLEWLRPLPGPWMHALFALLAVCALGIATGAFYRASALLFALGFTYAHLIDKTNYLNHYYLISLVALLLAVLPAHRAFSLDVLRRPHTRRAAVPAWTVWLLRFQLGVVYVFGAVAKLNPDWLLRAQPLRIWLAASADLPWLGGFLQTPAAAYLFSYAGLLFDAAVVPLLLWRRSRGFAYVAVLGFHLLTSLLFPIGMFPWLMICLTPIFFAADWPRRLVAAPVPRPADAPAPVALTRTRRLGLALAAAYALVQIVVPLRHLARRGDVYWTERGFRFAWQIMVMEKYGEVTFALRDAATGESWQVDPRAVLTAVQARMMATQPDMIRDFARATAAEQRRRSGHPIEIRADSWATLNGRKHRRLIDPRVDLAAVDSAAEEWILPAPEAPRATAERPSTDGWRSELSGEWNRSTSPRQGGGATAAITARPGPRSPWKRASSGAPLSSRDATDSPG